MFRLYVIAILLYVSGSCVKVKCECNSTKSSSAVRVKTDAGWLCGKLRNAENGTLYASFRGVPYGQPPLGKLRFKELEPKSWEGDWDATEESPACPQKDILYGRLALQKKGMSEDCIYCNVHVPYRHLPQEGTCTDPGSGIPILVVIHGGAFNVGSGLTDVHGPEYLMTKDVMVITFNYRINVFGFLSLNCSEVPGNQGLRDQVALLRWVQRNARAFGGNPDNVTLIGQSSGAFSAHLLTLSNATEGLFNRVILHSGIGIPNLFTASPTYAASIAATFLSLVGINSTDTSVIFEQLTQLPLVDIMHANTIVQNTYGLITFSPVVEQTYENVTRILDDTPLNLIADGRGKQYPFLFGFCDQEFETMRWMSLILNLLQRVIDDPKLLLSPRLLYLPEDQVSNITQIVYDKCFNGTETLDKLIPYLSYSYFKYPAFKLADWRAKYAPVYFFKYSYKSERSLIKEGLWLEYEGAGHAEDWTYVFRTNSMLGDHVSFPPRNNDDEMKEFMVTMVTNFMSCSNTSACFEEDWPQYSRAQPQYQSIAEPNVPLMANFTAEEIDMVKFLDGIDAEIRNLKI